MNEIQQEQKGFWRAFLKFALKGNVIELAVAFVVGGAFAKITTSIVNDLVMPLMNPLIPGGDWRELTLEPGVRIGSFLGALLDFVIIALAMFMVVRMLGRLRRDS